MRADDDHYFINDLEYLYDDRLVWSFKVQEFPVVAGDISQLVDRFS